MTLILKMKRVIVASENNVKINAVKIGIESVYDDLSVVKGISVESGVSDQPMTNEETLKGALNRAINASIAHPDAEFWVGLEGGVEMAGDEMESFAWVVIKSRDGRIGKARTGTFFLPNKIVELIKQGKELGEADDIVFNKNNSKQNSGAVGLLTRDVITRDKYYAEAVILALIPFLKEELY